MFTNFLTDSWMTGLVRISMTGECPGDLSAYHLADWLLTDLMIGLANGPVIDWLTDWLTSSTTWAADWTVEWLTGSLHLSD